jgi:cysteine-rich repeat protein
VLTSTNGGGSWSPLGTGLPPTIVYAVAIDPATPTTLYAGTYAHGVFALHECGDGTVDAGEQCDDGNATSGDGCSAACVLEPCAASPKPLCGVAGQAQMQLSEKTPGKERMKVQWKKLAGSTTLAGFGDPVTGSTAAAVCLYDDAGALVQAYEVDRAGQQCAGKPCWAPKSGYAYKDKLAASDGIGAIGYKPGPSGKGQARVAGGNNAAKGQNALPTGVVAALTGNTQPTVQLLTTDGFCIGARMTVSKDQGGQYKAKR